MEFQERSFKSFVQMLMDNFTSRIDGLVKDVQSVKDSLQYSQSDIDVLKNDSSSYNKLIENLENKISVIQAHLGDAADKRDFDHFLMYCNDWKLFKYILFCLHLL